MVQAARRHLLGIDEGPFQKHVTDSVPVVGVMMEGADLVEAVAVTAFPVDGEGVTGFLADWVCGLRCHPALQGVLLGGITMAGLSVVDVDELARAVGVPVLNVNRREPRNDRLQEALTAAGLHHRFRIVECAPLAVEVETGLWVAAAGLDPLEAAEWVRAARGKSQLPEPLRIAHLLAGAIVSGESRGRP